MKFQNTKTALFLLILLALILNSFACSSSNHEEHKMPMKKGEMSETQTYKSVGIVKTIDAEKGTITIDHEDIPGYMSAMKMTEPVANKKLLESVKVDDKVNFEIERIGAKIVITQIEKSE